MWKHYRTNEDLLQLLNKELNENFAKTAKEKIELKYN
jgi:hypothetical protein